MSGIQGLAFICLLLGLSSAISVNKLRHQGGNVLYFEVENEVVDQVERSKSLTSEVTGVTCPDGKSECPDGNTCCKMTDGEWGCCPSPNAVCCDDHIHCCPHGYTCDTSSGTCNKGDLAIQLLMKQPSTSLISKVTSVTCPDGKSECPDGNTCCKMTDGEWGCCPSPNAVCCDDHIHCCPHGYTCDTSSGTCNRGDLAIQLLMKQPSKSLISKVTSVTCPDGKSECPDANTCCKLTDGEWGCCPSPNAVCCDDHIHCCPHGYTCDTSSGSCNKGDLAIQLLMKQPSTSLISKVTSVTCPDGKSECPDGNTCCKMTDGEWGCCPSPNGVCCPNDKCCPHGTSCGSNGRCVRNTANPFPFFKTVQSKDIQVTEV